MAPNASRDGNSELAGTEAERIARAREGDQEAFRQLYDDHVDRVFRLAYRMTGDEELAKDLTQDAFVRAYQRLDQFEGRSAFSTWLHTVAVSVALNAIRKRKRRWDTTTSFDDRVETIAAPAETPVEVGERIHQAVDALPEGYRVVFLMHDMEGFNHREIAGSLGIAEGTSKARLSRARKRLRGLLWDLSEEYAR